MRDTRPAGLAVFLLLAIVTVATATAFARPGRPDSSFGSKGLTTTSFNREGDQLHALAVDSEGRILAGGAAGVSSTNEVFGLARYTADGSLDPSFGGDGKAEVSFADDPGYGGVVTGIAIQPDGKIVAAGWMRQTTGRVADFAVARLNPDGTLDRSFSDDGMIVADIAGPDDEARDVVLQADGKIVLVGMATAAPKRSAYRIAAVRYLPNGELDASFGDGGTALLPAAGRGSAYVGGAAVQPDGRLLVAGSTYPPKGQKEDRFLVARLTEDGALDPSFGSGGFVLTDFPAPAFNPAAADVTLDSKRRILVAGEVTRCGDSDCFDELRDLAVARYRPNGRLDRSFSKDGLALAGRRSADEGGSALALQPNDAVVVAGNRRDLEFVVARLDKRGRIDRRFGRKGLITAFQGSGGYTGAEAVVVAGKRIVAGGPVEARGGTLRFGLAAFRTR